MSTASRPNYHPAHVDRLVTVCDKCRRASCWHGEFFCDEARGAGLVDMPIAELQKLELEHPEYWFTDPATGEIDRQSLAEYIRTSRCGGAL